MEFQIHFQCNEANCYSVAIENLMHGQVELLFAENGTVHMYKGNIPDERRMQAQWRLEPDGEYFQIKNEEFGTFLQMDEIIDDSGYEISLEDITLDLNSDKTKWKIDRCNDMK